MILARVRYQTISILRRKIRLTDTVDWALDGPAIGTVTPSNQGVCRRDDKVFGAGQTECANSAADGISRETG